MHVTPEPECSYASFETNTPLKSYDSLINNVLRVFKPKRFVLTMMVRVFRLCVCVCVSVCVCMCLS